jgi:hypothetical protein
VSFQLSVDSFCPWWFWAEVGIASNADTANRRHCK